MKSMGTSNLVDLLSPRFEVVLGARWRIVFNHRVLLRLEQLTGKSTLTGEINPWKLDSSDLKNILLATSESQGVMGVDLRALRGRNVPQVINVLQLAWEWAMPLPEAANGTSGAGACEPTGWMDAWANAHECLRMTSDEWLDSTPQMIQSLGVHRLETIRQGEWMLAQIASTTANFSQCHPRDPVKSETFMLHPWENLPSADSSQSLDGILRGFKDARWVDPSSRQVIADLLNDGLIN